MFRNFGPTKEMKQKGHGYLLHNWPDSGPPKLRQYPAGLLSQHRAHQLGCSKAGHDPPGRFWVSPGCEQTCCRCPCAPAERLMSCYTGPQHQ